MKKTALISFAAAASALIGGLAVWFLALRVPAVPDSGNPKQDAAASIVAWIVEDRAIPGTQDRYADSGFMPEIDRFYVCCDFLPVDTHLSNDPRVVLVPGGEWEKPFSRVKEVNWEWMEDEVGKISFILMSFHKERGDRFAIHASNVFGPLAGGGWYFVFAVEDGQLKTSIVGKWVA